MKKFYKTFSDNKVLSATFGVLLLLCIFFILRLLVNNSSPNNIFAKGILIINMNKQNYFPYEKMNIGILSLDDDGNNICTSNLKLEITNPDNSVSEISVTPSPTCNSVDVTNDPDYVASHTLEKIGEYKLKLTNLDTKKFVETKIKVSQNLPFDIKRSGASRIKTEGANRYPMIITVKTDQDFQGQIKDQFPEGVKIVWQGPAKVGDGQIIWDVDLKAGEENTFSYEYEAIQTESGIYKFGPINLSGQNIESTWRAVLEK